MCKIVNIMYFKNVVSHIALRHAEIVYYIIKASAYIKSEFIYLLLEDNFIINTLHFIIKAILTS